MVGDEHMAHRSERNTRKHQLSGNTALLMLGKENEGLAEFRKMCERGGMNPLMPGGMGLISGILNREEDARLMFAELTELSRSAWVPPLAFAWAYLGLRDERVFERLDKAIDARDPAVTHMPSMPFYDGIRDDPRFHKLLAKMGLA